VAPERLELEITEGLFIEPYAEVGSTLRRLHDAGVRLAMDDFGTGYSSLSHLRRYPFDTLKVDRSFIRDIIEDPADRELVIAAIAMARGLGLSVIAEGVETQAQHDLLCSQGCDSAQGYFYAVPMTADALGDCRSRCMGATTASGGGVKADGPDACQTRALSATTSTRAGPSCARARASASASPASLSAAQAPIAAGGRSRSSRGSRT
jgi:predicted signal transduction protein with EAL and GGDEF domain